MTEKKSRRCLPSYNSKKEYESNIHAYRVANNLTCRELSIKANVSVQWITSLANGTESPVRIDGRLRLPAQRLCNFFNASPEELFPRYICTINRSEKFHTNTYTTYSEMIARDPCEIIIEKEYVQNIVRHAHLTKNELFVVRKIVYWNSTLREVGRELNTSQTQISNIYSRAMRKIRIGIREKSFHEMSQWKN